MILNRLSQVRRTTRAGLLMQSDYRDSLASDSFVEEFLKEVLKELRVQYILDYVRPYAAVRMDKLASVRMAHQTCYCLGFVTDMVACLFYFWIFHVFLCVLDCFILPSCSICIRMTSNPFWSRLFWMAAWMRVLTEWSRYSNCHAHQLVMHTTTHDRLCTHGTIKCGNLQWPSLANRVSG